MFEQANMHAIHRVELLKLDPDFQKDADVLVQVLKSLANGHITAAGLGDLDEETQKKFRIVVWMFEKKWLVRVITITDGEHQTLEGCDYEDDFYPRPTAPLTPQTCRRFLAAARHHPDRYVIVDIEMPDDAIIAHIKRRRTDAHSRGRHTYPKRSIDYEQTQRDIEIYKANPQTEEEWDLLLDAIDPHAASRANRSNEKRKLKRRRAELYKMTKPVDGMPFLDRVPTSPRTPSPSKPRRRAPRH